jgi:hypothetical protein
MPRANVIQGVHEDTQMQTDGAASVNGTALGLSLAEAYRMLDDKRLDIDRRIAGLGTNDPARDELWLELEPVLTKLRTVVSELAKVQAVHLAELQAKAAVLARLLRPEDDNSGQVIPDAERSALALSLTDDIAQLSNG